jgi:hypothetical protein
VTKILPGRNAKLWSLVLPALLGLSFAAAPARAATLTVQTNQLGPTPTLLGYNSGHFYPGSNTREWWRYAGVTGARVFISPSNIEPSDDVAPVGDGVNSQAAFLARRAAIRTNQFNSSYINWSVFTNNYQNNDLAGNNHIKVNFALSEMRKLGIRICAQITASASRLPLSGSSDWPNMWELWQHYYAQAFYLGRYYDVERYQMYNEPNHSPVVPQDDYMLRLQLASDAIQLALADVNSLYGKSLAPTMLAPVSSGGADSPYAEWGAMVVTNRHVNFLGQTDPNFWLLQVYDYHQYNASPSSFGNGLANLQSLIASDMVPEPPFPTAISEFNTYMAATFDTMTETLDSPTQYPRFGSIVVNLMANACSELYCFKFSQTDYTGSYPVTKNAMHYVDNNNSPYNVGGITKAGEVWRLLNKAFAPGRTRLYTARGSGATSLDVHTSYDAATQRYYLFSANNTTSDVSLSLALAACNIPTNNMVLVEEVSEGCYGAGRIWTNAGTSRTVSGTLGSNSVWLLTAPLRGQQPEQIVAATDDAEVRDGTNKALNYGTNAVMSVQNDPANAANRSAAFLKFHLPTGGLTNLQFALLSVYASGTTNTPIQAHVYGIDSNNWAQSTLRWTNAPNLKDNSAAGALIANKVVEGLGTNAHLAGQLVVAATNAYERLIDVTDFLRGLTNSDASFLISQDPRWDVTLPSLDAGDIQAGGIRIIAQEGAVSGTPGPRLRLVFNAITNPPVAVNDSYSTPEDVPLAVAAPGVLANDSNGGAPAMTAVLLAGTTNGTLALAADGSFTYLPITNYFGPDSFTYKANNGLTDSAPATVTLSITALNDNPFAANDIAATTQGVAVVISVLTNDYDVDGDTLSIQSFTQATSGSVSNSGNGALTYTPVGSFYGPDSFSYTLADGHGGTATATVGVTVAPAPGLPGAVWTNLTVATEAFIRGGVNAPTNQDEAATGYIMVKYNASPFDSARKAYFQFDLTGLALDLNTQAVFTVTTYTQAFQQRVQLWGLKQAYTNFSADITWNAAQANETNSNNLLTSGAYTAATIGSPVLIPGTINLQRTFTLPRLGDYTWSNRVTLVLAGVADSGSETNNPGGLRLQRANATLQVLLSPASPATNAPQQATAIRANADGTVTIDFLGGALQSYVVQAATNPGAAPWTSIGTNTSATNGTWSFTDSQAPSHPSRFYRSAAP